MMKKLMFPALAMSGAVALTFSIYLYQQSIDPDAVVVVPHQDRMIAGGPEGPAYNPPADTPPMQEAPPDTTCRPGKDCYNPAPAAPAPAYVAPPALTQDCIARSFVADGNSNCTGCIKNVNFSQSYINMFLNAAYSQPYNARGTDRQRLAIMGLVSAGYCPREVNYSGAYQLPATSIIPQVQGAAVSWRTITLDTRANSWRVNQRANPLFCEADRFGDTGLRRRICETIYVNCNLRPYMQHDCYGVIRDNDDGDSGGNNGRNTGGSSTGGSTTGQKEVDNSNGQTNENQGQGADRSGGQGDGPPGMSQ